MKYDFSTYILNKLNEADEKKKKEPNITINPDGKQVIISSNTTEKELVNFFKKHIDDIDIKEEGDKKVYVYNGEKGEYSFEDKSGLPFDKLYKKALEESRGDNDQKLLDEDGFKLLGKTIAYRSALTAWSIINNSGDDFKQAALDVFKDNSEYSIKQLENLDSLLDYSAADLTIKQKIKRNDKNDANYEKNLKTYKEYEEQLKSKENFKTIQAIKKNYEKEFKDTREVLYKAFNDGMAEQKKEMQSKDYKWKDPATGKEPKGAEKLNQLGDKAYKMIESGVEKFADFAKRQQGLDKAILTLAVVGVKGMMFGAKMLKNLLTGAIKRTNLHDCLRNTAKFKDVENKIKIFMKEFEEWNKENQEQSKKDDKDKTDEEKRQEEDKKKTILMKLSELMNTHVMPYYYAKLGIITACIENKENKYIIKQEDNKWSTYNTSTGRLTVIEDNTILMYHLLKFLTDEKQIPGFRTGFKKVLETFGDEKPDFKLPTDVNFNPTYKSNLSKWLDRASTVKDIKNPHLPFNIEQFKKNWEKFYTADLYKKSFANYKEFLEFCRKAQELVHDVHLPVAKGIRLKFKGDEDAGVPGVVTGANQGENKEEQNPEENKEEKENYQKILNSVEEIKNAANAEEIAKNYGDTKGKVDTAVKQIQSNIQDQEKKDFLDKHFQNIEKADTLTKMMYLNTAKSKGLFDSCVAFNDAMNMLLEATDDDNTNGYEEIFKQMVALLNGDSNEEKIKEFQELDNKLKDALKDKIKDDGVKKTLGEDPLAIYSFLNKPKQDNKDEQDKIDNTIEDTKKALEFAEDVKEVFTTEYYDKLKAELKTIYDKIEKICDNNDDKLKAFTDVTIDDEIKSDLIPNLWKYKRFLTLISESKSFYYHDFMILLEEENVVDELTKKAQVIKKLLTYENEPDFNKDYKEWREGVNTEFEKFEKIENKDSLKDPVQKLSAMGMYVKNNKNKPEEKKEEGEQTNGDNKPDQENGENKQET
jgi:hypothetical protein